MSGFGDPAELVAEAGQTFADELEQPEMDRPWFCSAYAAAGYFMCDPLTNVPKWCSIDSADFWCPDDEGYEYDGVTGGGGSSGGAGASRTWEVEKCFDPAGEVIPCSGFKSNYWCYELNGYQKTCSWATSSLESCREYHYFYKDGIEYVSDRDYLPCTVAGFQDMDGNSVGSEYYRNNVSKNFDLIVDGACYKWDRSTGEAVRVKVPCELMIQQSPTIDKEKSSNSMCFNSTMLFVDCTTYFPVTNDKFESGIPINVPLPVDPTIPVDPDNPIPSGDCAALICQCIAFVVQAVNKVDESVLKVVSAVTNFKPDLPEPLDLKPVTVELQRILKAIDDITVEMVKEAGTNFWDVLGGAFGDIFDLIEFLIEKIIYLVIPEDSSSIVNAFDLLRADLMSKVSPIHEIQQHITDSIPNEQKEFENIKINLPRYGEVTFFKADYLLMAIPFIRQLLAAIMVLLTAIWAYRKVSSEMVK